MDKDEIKHAIEFLATIQRKQGEHRRAADELDPLIMSVKAFIAAGSGTDTISSIVGTNGDTPKPQPETAKQELSDLNLTGLSRKKAAPVVVRAANRWLTAREIV